MAMYTPELKDAKEVLAGEWGDLQETVSVGLHRDLMADWLVDRGWRWRDQGPGLPGYWLAPTAQERYDLGEAFQLAFTAEALEGADSTGRSPRTSR